ncbi:MAG: hypothetical protein EOP61_01890 [Sphingomonadales bacterium]|nr:MAG: hypothetical protein EOP61_01890 [Sphingomonadales bacterium]
MIGKNEWIGIAIGLLLTAAVFIGSTGLGYADYRPLRNYDIFSLVIAWVGSFLYIWKVRRSET